MFPINNLRIRPRATLKVYDDAYFVPPLESTVTRTRNPTQQSRSIGALRYVAVTLQKSGESIYPPPQIAR